MDSAPGAITVRAIRTPRAAAVAGLIFSVLFATSAVLTEWAIPPGSDGASSWIIDTAKRDVVSFSLQLLPFAGIAFLWFIGAVRARIGEGEDRFFATVFLGSGLLFVATFFVSGAVSAGLIDAAAETPGGGTLAPLWSSGGETVATLASVYGLRMAAVFTISATTIASRLQLVPLWLAVLGYTTAIVLLLGVGLVPWLELAFPMWVFVLSVHILLVAYRRGPQAQPDDRSLGRG